MTLLHSTDWQMIVPIVFHKTSGIYTSHHEVSLFLVLASSRRSVSWAQLTERLEEAILVWAPYPSVKFQLNFAIF